jgi:O-antigen/teichoic acid export membrane protein
VTQRRVRDDTLVVLAGQIIALATTLILTPVQLQRMGYAHYGLLSLAVSVAGLSGFLDYGLGWTALRYIPLMHGATGVRALARRLVRLAGAVGLLAAFVPAVLLPLAIPGTPPKAIVALACLIIPASVVAGSLTSIIRATGDYRRSTLVATATVVSTNVVWVLAAGRQHDVATVLAWQLFAAVASSLYWWHRLPTGDEGPAQFVRPREMLRFAVLSAFVGLSVVLISAADKFLVGAAVGVALLPFYSIPVSLASRLTLLSSSLTAVVFPRMSRAHGEGPATDAHALSGRILTGAAATTATILAGILWAGPSFFSLWISPEFAEETRWTLRSLAIGFAVYGVGQLGYAANDARGRVGRSLWTVLSVTIPTLGLMALAARLQGVEAAALTFSTGLVIHGLLGMTLSGGGRALLRAQALLLIFVPLVFAGLAARVSAILALPALPEILIVCSVLLPALAWQVRVLRPRQGG